VNAGPGGEDLAPAGAPGGGIAILRGGYVATELAGPAGQGSEAEHEEPAA